MDYDKLRIELEISIRNELYDLFEGSIVEKIIKKAKVENEQNIYKIIHEGHSFRITGELAPDLYALCCQVKESLDFKEDVEFYITNSSDANAYAVSKLDDGDTNLIVLHSRIIDQFDQDELKFVIGHEMGHLISDNAKFMRIIDFVFPDYSQIPVVFMHKISLWQKLSELTADRFGYIASPDLNKCVSNFFKLASGLTTDKIKFVHANYIKEMEKLIEQFKTNPFGDTSSHPVNPIRIKALQHFSQSSLYREIRDTPSDTSVKELEEKLADLLHILMILGNSELDQQRAIFLAAGGFMAASADREINQDELEFIVNNLSGFIMFPKKFLDDLFASNRMTELFKKSVVSILAVNPSERYSMFGFMVSMVMADRTISDPEIDFLFTTGQTLFNMTEKEISQIIGGSIQREFHPRLF